mmetsp:Transcript_30363/g.68087  ORF Transcript_30363/g.68087 Transcript_30363/m.68087 type:complete len:265 (+) Transcript_30363:1214-2008(+)
MTICPLVQGWGRFHLDVDGHVRDALAGVDEDPGASFLGERRHLRHRVHRAQHVGHVRQGDQLRPARNEELLQVLEVVALLLVQLHELEEHALLLGEDLPRYQVGVVLGDAQDDLVPGPEVGRPPSLRHQVNRLGRPPGEHDFLPPRRVHEGSHLVPGRLVPLRGAPRQEVGPAVDVGVGLAVEGVERVQHHRGLLRRRGAVQVHQRLPRAALHAQDREVGPHLGGQGPPRAPRPGGFRGRRTGLGWCRGRGGLGGGGGSHPGWP